jgi:hypothetical protein
MQTYIYKWYQKNMKECDEGISHISSKLNVTYISSNNGRHPVTKTTSVSQIIPAP